jgi:hypothetical protein
MASSFSMQKSIEPGPSDGCYKPSGQFNGLAKEVALDKRALAVRADVSVRCDLDGHCSLFGHAAMRSSVAGAYRQTWVCAMPGMSLPAVKWLITQSSFWDVSMFPVPIPPSAAPWVSTKVVRTRRRWPSPYFERMRCSVATACVCPGTGMTFAGTISTLTPDA